MSKTKGLAVTKFSVGTEVRVKSGVTLPDLPDMPLGNWAGTISEVFADETPVTYEIEWNRRTLDDMPAIYRKRCERDGYEWDSVWLNEDELELNTGEALQMEHPSEIITRPLAMNDQEDRIRAIFHLTTDDRRMLNTRPCRSTTSISSITCHTRFKLATNQTPVAPEVSPIG